MSNVISDHFEKLVLVVFICMFAAIMYGVIVEPRERLALVAAKMQAQTHTLQSTNATKVIAPRLVVEFNGRVYLTVSCLADEAFFSNGSASDVPMQMFTDNGTVKCSSIPELR